MLIWSKWTIEFISGEVIVNLATGCFNGIIKLLTELDARKNRWTEVGEIENLVYREKIC